jgi:hypothetical protein
MLELLLSILALLGLSPDKSGEPITINADIYAKVSSNPSYKDLGGDDALNSIAVFGDPEANEAIIVTDQVDPLLQK